MTGLIAAEASEGAEGADELEKPLKQYSCEVSVDPEYTNYIHQILMQVGSFSSPIGAGPCPSDGRVWREEPRGICPGEGWRASEKFRFGDQLTIQDWNKNFDQLTVDEFRALHGSLIKALVHNGRAMK